VIFIFVSVGKHDECLCIELLFQPLPLLIFEQKNSLGMREIFVLEYTQYIRRTDRPWSSRIVRIFLSEGQPMWVCSAARKMLGHRPFLLLPGGLGIT